MPLPPRDPRADLVSEINAVLRRSETLWDLQDYDGLRSLWDSDETEPYYLAEEIERPLVGWGAIDEYWRNNQLHIESIRVRFSDLHAKLAAPGLAVAIYNLRFDVKLVGPRKSLGGENRVTALFRLKPDGWRYCHYVEAPLAPIIYVRRLYEIDVTAEFKASQERRG